MPDLSLKLIVLKTPQLDSVRGFYTRMGFQFVEEQHGSGPVHFSAPLGDGILEIYPLQEGASADSSTRLGFGVSDLPAVIETLARHAEVHGPKKTPWGLRAVVKDPDGRSVELYDEPARLSSRECNSLRALRTCWQLCLSESGIQAQTIKRVATK